MVVLHGVFIGCFLSSCNNKYLGQSAGIVPDDWALLSTKPGAVSFSSTAFFQQVIIKRSNNFNLKISNRYVTFSTDHMLLLFSSAAFY